jgi:hypothetical protein
MGTAEIVVFRYCTQQGKITIFEQALTILGLGPRGVKEKLMKLSFNSAALLKITLIAAATALVPASIGQANAVTARDFGAKGDVVTLSDGAMNKGTNAFSSNSASFTSADVGKAIVVTGAGPEGLSLVTKIQALISAKRVTLGTNAATTVAGALTYYGTDDTAAIRSCVYEGTARGGECTINDGVTFLVSNTRSTIAPLGGGHNPILKGTINGHGKIIFAPQGELTGGTNDRLFYISSHEAQPMQIAGAISKGASSFTAQDPSDAATLSPSDWVIITERDSAPMAGDNVFADWMEVSGVDGAVVQTMKPFRMAFPNGRPWSGPPKYWGLSFRKVAPITSNITIRDLTIIVPRILKIPQANHRALVGINTRDTRGTVVSNVNCQDASGNCFTGLLDQGLVFENNNIHDAIYSEFASEVDTTISENHINEPDTDLSLAGPPTSGGLEVDFGTGFSSIVGNSVGPTRQVCIQVSVGVHDTLVKGNTCGMVSFGTGANCILSRGGYRMTVTENVCEGGTGRGTGISFEDANGLTSPIYSDGNRIFKNTVRGFATPYSCPGGRLRTDSCDNRR